MIKSIAVHPMIDPGADQEAEVSPQLESDRHVTPRGRGRRRGAVEELEEVVN